MTEQARAYRLVPEYVEEFFKKTRKKQKGNEGRIYSY